jgi:hypothetical protein
LFAPFATGRLCACLPYSGFTRPPAVAAAPFRSNPLLFWIRGDSIPALGAVERSRLVRVCKCPVNLAHLCVEHPHSPEHRFRWPCAHRHTATANRKTPRQQGGALPPPRRPPLRAGYTARSPTKTRAPLHQPPQMNIPVLLTTINSCFENYATLTRYCVDGRRSSVS